MRDLNVASGTPGAISDVDLKEGEPAFRAGSSAEAWYCKVVGEQLGPFTFDEIVSFVEQGHLGDEVEVKIGADGEWSRVETVSRLVAVIPRDEFPSSDSRNPPADLTPKSAPKPTESASKPIPPSLAQAPTAAGPKVTVAQTVDAELINAQAAHSAIEQATKKLMVTVFGSKCEQVWWGWIGGVQYGPVDFVQLVGWVTDGRLRSTDFVRYGTQGQYALVGTVPGLLHAATIINHATEVLQLARSLAKTKTGDSSQQTISETQSSLRVAGTQPPKVVLNTTTASSVPPPVTLSSSATATVAASKASNPTAAGDVPVTKADASEIVSTRSHQGSEQSASASGNRAAFTPSPSSISRPVGSSSRKPTKPHRPKDQSALSQAVEKLKEPRIAAGTAAILAVLLLLVVWLQSSPAASAADIERYRELKKLLVDVRAKRDSKGTDFAEFKGRADKLKADYAPILKKEADNDHPAKQALLWAVQEELPRFMKQKLTTESKAEKDFAQRLDEAARLMRIKP